MMQIAQLKKQKKTCSTGKMGRGISNVQIEKAFEKLNDEDINDNFVGVFPANRMNRFIDYKTMMLGKKGKYPFIIANTDSSDKDGTHWWSIMDIDPRTDLFFYSFGADGLKNFIIQDDQEVIEKMGIFRNQFFCRMDF